MRVYDTSQGQRFLKAGELFVSECGETLSDGCTPPQLYRMARRLLLSVFAHSDPTMTTPELCELAIALYDTHLAAHCLETTAVEGSSSFLSSIEKDEVTRDIFNRIAAMTIRVASRRRQGDLRLVRVGSILSTRTVLKVEIIDIGRIKSSQYTYEYPL